MDNDKNKENLGIKQRAYRSVGYYMRSPVVRIPVLFVIYAFICFLSLLGSYFLRFDFVWHGTAMEQMKWIALWLIPTELFLLYIFGQFRGLLSFFSVYDLKKLLLFSVTMLVVQLLIGQLTRGVMIFPRGVILANFVISTVALASFRLTLRMVREKWFSAPHHKGSIFKVHQIRTGIIGADDTGAQLAQEFLSKPHRGMTPVVFIDDDPSKHQSTIHGIPVAGPISDLARIVCEEGLEKIVIAMPTASQAKIRHVVDLLNTIGIEYVTVPGWGEILSGKTSSTRLRQVEISDILGRDGIEIEMNDIRSLINGGQILVTGAGGSIGSELCRQILQLNPQRLVMVEQSEGNLFLIEQELIKAGYRQNIHPFVADICDRNRMEKIFEIYRPQIVFHAAAHKHVPLMELQPDEALKNNSWGTMQLAQLAVQYGVQRFVNISTDKAIRPTNVMGTSKRLGEMILQNIQQGQANSDSTKFISVRFGNVLGSSGSVVPIFEKQILAGGPVTVTHPDVTRYFMAIPEAVGLVLQAAVLGQGGDILILDMGKPIKIVDLAKQMIALHGLILGEDIDIEFSGLRPGEKLFEELNYEFENCQSTSHSKIMRITSQKEINSWEFQTKLSNLWESLKLSDINIIKQKMQELVTDYRPTAPRVHASCAAS